VYDPAMIWHKGRSKSPHAQTQKRGSLPRLWLVVLTTLVLGFSNHTGRAQGSIIFNTNSFPVFLGYPGFLTNIYLIPTPVWPPSPLPAAPSNDNFAAAAELAGIEIQTFGTNYSATAQAGEPSHDTFGPRRSLWYRWTAPADGFAELVVTALSAYVSPIEIAWPIAATNFQVVVWDPSLATNFILTANAVSLPRLSFIPPLGIGIYIGDTLASLTPVPLITDQAFPLESGSRKYRFRAVAGQTYRFAVDSWASYSFRLSLTLGTIQLSSPGQFAPAGVPVLFEFSALDTNAPIAWLEAFAETNSLGVRTSPPWVFEYSAASPGPVVFQAAGTNAAGDRVLALAQLVTFRPANDNLNDATLIPATRTEGYFSADTRYATAEPGEPPHHTAQAAAHSVWWRWTPQYTGEVAVSLSAPALWTTSSLGVYRGPNLDPVASLIAGGVVLPGASPNPTVSFQPEAGATYYIAVDNPSAAAWSFNQSTLDLWPSLSPQRGTAGLPVNLQAAWQDTAALPAQVDFIVGTPTWSYFWPGFGYSIQETGRLSSVMSAPYELQWIPAEPGIYYVWARATNFAGAVKESLKTQFQILAANDDFANAATIAPGTVVTNFAFNFFWTTPEANEPEHSFGPAGRSRWWKWTPSYSGRERVKVVQSGVGLPVDIFVRSGTDSLQRVASNKERVYLPGVSGFVRWQVRAGTTYYIRADDTRLLPAGPGQPGVPLPPPPLDVTFTLEPATAPLAGELNLSFCSARVSRVRPKQIQFVPFARVFMPDGRQPVTGSTYRAQLYAGPSPGELQPMGSAQPFIQGSFSGFESLAGTVLPAPVLITNVEALQRVWAQVRVWDLAFGESYEAALANGGLAGESKLLKLIAGSEEIGPAPLTGLTSFRLRPAAQ
jgi:hypothetical protein